MERSDPRYQAYVEILKEELIPAMGCTEPIALAYAAAKAREVLGMLQELHRQGNTVVLITHDNSIAVQAQRIIRLEDGRVVYDGDAHAPEAVVQPGCGIRTEQEGSAS